MGTAAGPTDRIHRHVGCPVRGPADRGWLPRSRSGDPGALPLPPDAGRSRIAGDGYLPGDHGGGSDVLRNLGAGEYGPLCSGEHVISPDLARRVDGESPHLSQEPQRGHGEITKDMGSSHRRRRQGQHNGDAGPQNRGGEQAHREDHPERWRVLHVVFRMLIRRWCVLG